MLSARDMRRRDDPTPAAVMRYLLEAAVVLKDVEACRTLEARMAPMGGLLHTEAEMCYNIGRLCGGAAALLGETDKARGYYQQAIEICEKVRFRPELALTRLELAELLLGSVSGAPAGAMNRAPTGDTGSAGARHASPSRAGRMPAPPEAQRAEALAHLDLAIAEFREMIMQPSRERALRHKELLKA